MRNEEKLSRLKKVKGHLESVKEHASNKRLKEEVAGDIEAMDFAIDVTAKAIGIAEVFE